MKGIKQFGLMVLILFSSFIWAKVPDTTWYSIKNEHVTLKVYLFIASTCPYCQQADAFLEKFAKANSWVELHRNVINEDKEAIQLFYQFLQEQQAHDFLVPSIFFCKNRWQGFNSTSSEQQISESLNYCYKQLLKEKKIGVPANNVIKQKVAAGWWENNIIKETRFISVFFELPFFDALGVSSLFLFLTFFAVVGINSKKNLTQALMTIITIVMGMGLAHFIQQYSIALFYESLFYFRIPAFLLGVVLISLVFAIYFKKISNISSSPLLIIAFLSTLVIQSYAQTNIPNFSLIFQEFLVSKGYSAVQVTFYSLMYQLIYLTTFALFIGLFSLILKRFINYTFYGKWSECYLLAIGFYLILDPQLFASTVFFVIIFVASLLCGLLKSRYHFLFKQA